MTLTNTAKDAAVNAVVDLLDASGNCKFETSGDVEVATLPLSATAFEASSNGTAAANTITSDTSATGGTIAQVSFYTSGGTKIFEASCSLSGGGGDVICTSLSIGAGDTVGISSFTVTQPA